MFYINRDIDIERDQSIREILKRFPKNVIYSYHRVKAVDQVGFPKAEWRPHPEIERLTRDNSKAEWYLYIFLSHLKAIQTFYHITRSKYGLILEDDWS